MRTLRALLAAVLSLSAFAACTGTESPPAPEPKVTHPQGSNTSGDAAAPAPTQAPAPGGW